MTTSFDYAGWVQRANACFQSLEQKHGSSLQTEVAIAPPLTPDAVDRIQEAVLPRQLPSAYRAFLLAGSGKFDFTYRFSPPVDSVISERLQEIFEGEDSLVSGAVLCDGQQLAQDLTECKVWTEDTWIAESPEDYELWANGLPFASMANGDYLALDLRNGIADPPVLYLSHEDTSKVLSPSFTSFLQIWEALGYAGPEIWVLEPFFDETSGCLTADTPKAAALQSLLNLVETET